MRQSNQTNRRGQEATRWPTCEAPVAGDRYTLGATHLFKRPGPFESSFEFFLCASFAFDLGLFALLITVDVCARPTGTTQNTLKSSTYTSLPVVFLRLVPIKRVRTVIASSLANRLSLCTMQITQYICLKKNSSIRKANFFLSIKNAQIKGIDQTHTHTYTFISNVNIKMIILSIPK